MPSEFALGGIDVTIIWSVTTATTGTAQFDVSWERMDDEGLDLDADSFATAVSGTGTAPATDGALQYTTVSFGSGQLDGIQPNEAFRLKVARNNTVGSNIAADCEVRRVFVRES